MYDRQKVAREIWLVLPANNMNQKRIQDCVATVLDKTVRNPDLGESFTVQIDDSTDVINLLKPAVFLLTTRFNIQKFYVVLALS
jgi:hypothetical protein